MINVVDRVPTEVLSNGAVRWEEFDENGVSQGYKWVKRADDPTVPGTPLNKTLFDDIDKYLCPPGMIAMWSGASNAIPTGWYLCNGQNGTPDLRNRFIVGAGDEYSVGSTGGQSTHILTIEEMPTHNHDFYAYNDSSTGRSRDYLETDRSIEPVRIETGRVSRTTSSDMISSVGGGQAHENRPPYYALCFIMKG